MRRYLFALVVLACSMLGVQAGAQTLTVDISPSASPDIGKVTAAASGDTLFHISPQGEVTTRSGTGVRITRGAVTPPTVTVHCTNFLLLICEGKPIYVHVGVSSATAPAKTIQNLTVEMGTASLNGGVSGSGSSALNFRINPVPSGSGRTFTLGMDLPVAAYGAGTGRGAASYYVEVGFLIPTSLISDTGQAAVTTLRPLTLNKLSDLTFGRAVRPISGGGTLTVSATGARNVTGGGVVLSSTFSPAAYEASGEGGQALDIDVPETFTMTNANGNLLTVTTNTTAFGLIGLSGSAGGTGTYRFYVGGSFPLTSTTASGAYAGSFPVTVSYN